MLSHRLSPFLRKLDLILNLFLLLNILYYFYQFFSNNFLGFYLLSPIFAEGASAISGILICFAFTIHIIIYNYSLSFARFDFAIKPSYFLLKSILFLFLSVGTVSRSSIIGSLILLLYSCYLCRSFLSFGLSRLYKLYLSRNLLLTLSTLSIAGFYIIPRINLAPVVLHRFGYLFNYLNHAESIYFDSTHSRFDIITSEVSKLEYFSPLRRLFGSGPASYEYFFNDGVKIGMHSQYSRLLIEFGFLGFFVLMVLFLIIHTPKGIFSSLSSFFLIFSIYIPYFVFYATYDVFVISHLWFGYLLQLV